MGQRLSNVPWLALVIACGDTARTPSLPSASARIDASPPARALSLAAPAPPGSARIDFPLGFFSAAAEVVRFRDKHGGIVSGIVFANGSDWGPQPLTMYAVGLQSGGGSFSQPWWVSSDAGYHTGICVGELDGSPGEDLAVTLQKDVYGDFAHGGVSAYYGVSKLQHKREAFRKAPNDLGSGFAASGCAIADLDQDGIGEVLVGSTGRRGMGRLFKRGPRTSGADATYDEVLTLGAKDAPACPGDPPDALAPSAVAISDVNDDGTPDLVLAGRRLAIFHGASAGSLVDRYGKIADWCSDEVIGFTPTVDVEHLARPRRTIVVVSQTCYQQVDCPANTYWHIYEPAKSRKPIITRAPVQAAIAGPAKLLNLVRDTGDQEVDLITTILFDRSQPDTFGSAMSVFKSLDRAGELGSVAEPWRADYRPVVSMLKAVNVLGGECDDLLVVSAHPARPSALFEDVGNCLQP
jgi:hypothetical protein